jgi:putative transposase
MARFRSVKSLQMFVSIHASIYNHFNLERHLYNREQFKSNRTVALNEWRQFAS